jgi:hypothetical protein
VALAGKFLRACAKPGLLARFSLFGAACFVSGPEKAGQSFFRPFISTSAGSFLALIAWSVFPVTKSLMSVSKNE